MLDVLADTYKIATRLDAAERGWLVPGTRPAERVADRVAQPVEAAPAAETRKPGGVVAALFGWLGRRRARARARAEILAMSDRTLKDIGWNRWDMLNQLDGRTE